MTLKEYEKLCDFCSNKAGVHHFVKREYWFCNSCYEIFKMFKQGELRWKKTGKLMKERSL